MDNCLREMLELQKHSSHSGTLFTTIGMKLWKTEHSANRKRGLDIVSAQVDQTSDGDISVDMVRTIVSSTQPSQQTSKLYTVLLVRGTMGCECSHNTQLRTFCSHMHLAATEAISKQLLPELEIDAFIQQNTPKFFNVNSILANTSIWKISHPSVSDLSGEENIITSTIECPPRYRDRKRWTTKRFRSRGETAGMSGNSISPNVPSPSKRGQESRYTYSSKLVSRERPTRGFIERHSTDAVDLTPRQRKPNSYLCSECGSADHTLRRCPVYLGGGGELVPDCSLDNGPYVVFKCRTGEQQYPADVNPVSLRTLSTASETFETVELNEFEQNVNLLYRNFQPSGATRLEDLEAEHQKQPTQDEEEEASLLAPSTPQVPDQPPAVPDPTPTVHQTPTVNAATPTVPDQPPEVPDPTPTEHQTPTVNAATPTVPDQLPAVPDQTPTEHQTPAVNHPPLEQADDNNSYSSLYERDILFDPPEILKAGDKISYYNPIGLAGNPDWFRETVIIEVSETEKPDDKMPDDWFPIVLENGEWLASDSRITRKEPKKFGEIQRFTLLKGALKDSEERVTRRKRKYSRIVEDVRKQMETIPEHLQTLPSAMKQVKRKKLFPTEEEEKEEMDCIEAWKYPDRTWVPHLSWGIPARKGSGSGSVESTCHMDSILAVFASLYVNSGLKGRLFELGSRSSILNKACQMLFDRDGDGARKLVFQSLSCYGESVFEDDGKTVDATYNVIDPLICLLPRSSKMVLKTKRHCSGKGCKGKTKETYVGNRASGDGRNILRTVTFKDYFPTNFHKAMDSKLHMKKASTRCLKNGCKGEATMVTEIVEMPKLLVVDGHQSGWNMLFTKLPRRVTWDGTEFEQKGIILHSPREKHFTSITVLSDHYLFHCGLKCPNSKVIPKESVEASDREARRVQGVGYWVSLVIYENLD